MHKTILPLLLLLFSACSEMEIHRRHYFAQDEEKKVPEVSVNLNQKDFSLSALGHLITDWRGPPLLPLPVVPANDIEEEIYKERQTVENVYIKRKNAEEIAAQDLHDVSWSLVLSNGEILKGEFHNHQSYGIISFQKKDATLQDHMTLIIQGPAAPEIKFNIQAKYDVSYHAYRLPGCRHGPAPLVFP